MDTRIIDLETQLSYQAREIAELNSVVIALREQSEGLIRRFEILEKTVRQYLPAEVKPLAEESPPPHY